MKILVVEDEPFIRQSFAEGLRDKGHEVIAARDGIEALKLLEDGGFETIFLDVVMPGLDGMEFLREARERGLLKCPVVVVTAHQEFKADKFPEVVSVLCKPVRSEDLLARLEAGGVP